MSHDAIVPAAHRSRHSGLTGVLNTIPKGLPTAQVKRVHDAVAAAFDAPDVKEAMAKQGNVIQISTPEQALATFKAEGARFAALVKKAGVTPQ